MNLDLVVIRNAADLAPYCTPAELAAHVVNWLGTFGDNLQDTASAVDYALAEEPGRGGFVVLAMEDGRPVGALVMLDTGMGGFIPRHHLVYVGVDAAMRGRGLGKAIVNRAQDEAGGPISLHVDEDNPAIRLYERLGFQKKYLEMRT